MSAALEQSRFYFLALYIYVTKDHLGWNMNPRLNALECPTKDSTQIK